MIGPSFEYKYFIEFIYLKDDYQEIPMVSCIIAGFKTYTLGIIFAVLTLISSPYFSQEIAFSDVFRSWPFYLRILFSCLSLELIKIRYMAGFLLSEGLIKLTGLSYDPTNETNKHEKIYSVNVFVCLFDIDMNRRLREWNRQIHLWLKYNIYCRLQNIPVVLAAFITFMICAFWHGLRISYPIFFIVFFLLQQLWEGFMKNLGWDKPSNKLSYVLILL